MRRWATVWRETGPTSRRREKGEEGKRKGLVGLRVGPVGLSSFSSHYFWIHSASSKSFDT